MLGILRFFGAVGAVALAFGVWSASAQETMSEPAATDQSGTTAAPIATEMPSDPAALEKFIHDYLLAHPEVIIESVQLFQVEQERLKAELAAKSLVDRRQELVYAPNSPVVGDPDGDVAVVEFFDYQCPYCKVMANNKFMETLEQDGNIRIVFKEFPILGPESEYAARAALAAHRQGKYRELHQAFMAFKGKMKFEDVIKIAEEHGLDIEQLKKDMESQEVAQELADNHALAKAVGISGTPAFIINDELFPGAVDMSEIMKRIAAARQG
ncbi:MAG: DsbA family protein [Dongiaceae bacterium]